MNKLFERGLEKTKEIAPVIADKVRTGAMITFAYLLHFNAYPIVAKILPPEAVRNFGLSLPLNPTWTLENLQGLGLSPEVSALLTVASIALPVIPLSILAISKFGLYSPSK